ncbi:hypothetical protein ACIHEI_06190 [Kitasatospora sp. NPDC051984]|uniref:hypothetical protein n=1 Tax=Kitasatospora sp. NPDC051984 TaxID=3364059 RepID=UPI0037CC967F
MTAAAARIAGILTECARRHEALHRQVITARSIFLDEQDRQAFRPPALGHLPDLGQEVLTPLLGLDTDTALLVADRWLSDITGPRAPKLPRLYRLIDDLWAARGPLEGTRDPGDTDEEIGDANPPTIPPEVITAAQGVVTRTGMPTRLSALLAGALTDDESAAPRQRQQTAEILALRRCGATPPKTSKPTSRSPPTSRRVAVAGGIDQCRRQVGQGAVVGQSQGAEIVELVLGLLVGALPPGHVAGESVEPAVADCLRKDSAEGSERVLEGGELVSVGNPVEVGAVDDPGGDVGQQQVAQSRQDSLAPTGQVGSQGG